MAALPRGRGWRRILLSLLLAACSSGAPPVGETGETGAPVEDLPEPIAEVDVLVIGSGPAGLAAAHAAVGAGVDVLVVEREAEIGGSGFYPGNYFASGSRFQVERGVPDEPSIAAADWPMFTRGGAGDDPSVLRYLEESGPTVEWLVDDLGARFIDLRSDAYSGPMPRIHILQAGAEAPLTVLAAELEDRVWTGTEAAALVLGDDGSVLGARITDQVTGEESWVRATATVIASGGFARSLERTLWDRPELEGLQLVADHAPSVLGAGHDLALDIGGAWQNDGGIGVYVRAVADPRPGFEDEALGITGLEEALIVDAKGRRVMNEDETRGFSAIDKMVAAPDGQLFALFPAGLFLRDDRPLKAPPYLVEEEGAAPFVLPTEAVELGIVKVHESVDAVGAGWGIDADGLESTLLRYEELVRLRVDEDFGKPGPMLVGFGGGGIASMQLVGGRTKAFSGLRTDVEGRLLDSSEEPIPGVFAAGEVAGMLGSAAAGRGWTGSITAVYASGRRAGSAAAALSR